jgi:hypothetical protein
VESATVMMKTRFPRVAAALALAATFALPGCIKSDSKTTLNKDGSGVVTQRMEMDLSQFKALADLANSFGGGAPGGEPGMDAGGMADPSMDPMAEIKELEAKLKKIEGLTVKDFKSEQKDGKYVTAFTAEFKEWSLLGQAKVFGGTTELVKNADGSYTFSMDSSAGSQMGDGGAPGAPPAGGEPGMDPGMPAMDPSMLAPMLEQFLGSMEFASSLTVPGTIVETNGTKSEDGSTVTWKVGFKEIFGAKDAGLMKVTFKGEGLELKPFKYVPNLAEMKDMVGGKKEEKPTTPPVTPPVENPAPPK